MLSVINRGTQTGSEVNGIPFKMVDGYGDGAYNGSPIEVIKLSNIATPLSVNLPCTVLDSYEQTESVVISTQNLISVTLQPIIKSGYTATEVEPRVN